jgi:hypothetical protein
MTADEIPVPRRTTPTRHRCLCRITVSLPPQLAARADDRCPRYVDDPDSPFCAECESTPGHAYDLGGIPR